MGPKENTNVILALVEDCLQLCDKENVTFDDRLIFDLPDTVVPPLQMRDRDREKSKNKEGLVNSGSIRLILDNPKGKGISLECLKMDENLERILGIERYRKDLSGFKLVLGNQNDAAHAIIDAEECSIRILQKHSEGDNWQDDMTSNDKYQLVQI